MPIPATHVFGGIVTAADINTMAATINTNEAAIAARWNRILTKRTITGNYTLVAADAIDMVLHSTSATDITITLPQDSDASIAQGTAIPWRQYGAGEMTFVAGGGAIVTARNGATKTLGQYTEGFVTKAAANAWVVSGNTVVPAGGTAPGAPTSVTAVGMGPTRVRVMWTAPTTGTVTGYKIYRGGVLQATLVGTTTSAHLDTATKKEIAQEIVCTAENSSLDWRAQYGYLEDIGDGRGYTGGIIGFTSGTHDMLVLVQLYNSRAPGNVLQPYTNALIAVDGTASHTGLGAGFEAAWATAALDPVFRKCQDDERDRVYFGPAVAAGVADGLRALGQFIYYDTYVNHGPGTDEDSFDGIRAEAKTRSSPPSQGGSESAYLTNFIQARKESLERFGYTEFTRTEAQDSFVAAGKFDLIPPLSWSMYGDPFTIAGQPWVDTTTTGLTSYSYTVTAIGSDGLESAASSAANVTTTATIDEKLAAKVALWEDFMEGVNATFVPSTYYAGVNSYTAPVRYYTTTSVVTAINAAASIAAVETALDAFETTYGFTVRFPTTAGSDSGSFSAVSWAALTSADLAQVKAAATYIVEEYAKYPAASVTGATHLTFVTVTKTLLHSGTAYNGFHLNSGSDSRLYLRLEISAGNGPSTNPEYWRRLIHHEHAHAIDAFSATARNAQQTEWTGRNAQAYGTTFDLSADHPLSFIDDYAITNYTEDRAQVHAAMMSQPRYNQLARWIGRAQLPEPTASPDAGDAYRYYRFRPISLRKDFALIQMSEFALFNGTTRLFPVTPKSQLVTLIQNVTTSSAHVYTAKDSSNNTMDTVKIIDDPLGGYFAVYHSGTTVRLARSTNLTTWTSPVVLDTLSSQPTIRYLPSTGGFLVGMEHHASGGQIRIKHYVSRTALLAGTANLTFTATRQLSPCNEGTPHFDNVVLNPDINNSVITIGMHHHECDLPADTDRQSVGTLTNFNSWSSVKTPAVSAALIAAAAAVGQTVNGNIGDRDNLTLGGVKFGIHEVQYNFGPTGQNNSFASWRTYLYDYSTGTAQLLNITTHNGSTAFANPSYSLVTSPAGVPAIVVCLFLPSEGAGTNEAGPCIYWKPLPALTASQTPQRTNPVGQTPAQAVDDIPATKWLHFDGVAATLTYDFGTPTVATKYRWATGNDFSERDPVSWVVEGSQNNTSWTALHTVTGYETPITRGVYTADFTLP